MGMLGLFLTRLEMLICRDGMDDPSGETAPAGLFVVFLRGTAAEDFVLVVGCRRLSSLFIFNFANDLISVIIITCKCSLSVYAMLKLGDSSD